MLARPLSRLELQPDDKEEVGCSAGCAGLLPNRLTCLPLPLLVQLEAVKRAQQQQQQQLQGQQQQGQQPAYLQVRPPAAAAA